MIAFMGSLRFKAVFTKKVPIFTGYFQFIVEKRRRIFSSSLFDFEENATEVSSKETGFIPAFKLIVSIYP